MGSCWDPCTCFWGHNSNNTHFYAQRQVKIHCPWVVYTSVSANKSQVQFPVGSYVGTVQKSIGPICPQCVFGCFFLKVWRGMTSLSNLSINIGRKPQKKMWYCRINWNILAVQIHAIFHFLEICFFLWKNDCFGIGTVIGPIIGPISTRTRVSEIRCGVTHRSQAITVASVWSCAHCSRSVCRQHTQDADATRKHVTRTIHKAAVRELVALVFGWHHARYGLAT